MHLPPAFCYQLYMASLVSIIMPAYNAAATISQAIASATTQTHQAIEIIVVDDGSTDDTAAIVNAAAKADQRIRLVSQENQGVAIARNRGIAEASGSYIAPLDADDIWHPEKIARQAQAIEFAPQDVGLVYNWFRRIDGNNRVEAGSPHPRIEGWVFHQHLSWNFISNGSTPLIRATALADIRYEPSLHRAGNQGCEDYLLQLQLAQRYRFLCVPAYLTGYRKLSDGMSKNAARMIRSHLQMYDIISASAPSSSHPIIRGERARLAVELARNHLRRGAWSSAGSLLTEALRKEPRAAARAMLREIRRAGATLSADPGITADQKVLRPFVSYSPEEHDGPWTPKRSPQQMAMLRRLDGLGQSA